MTPGPLSVEKAWLVGEEAGDRLASGLWPPDHAGVIVTLELSRTTEPTHHHRGRLEPHTIRRDDRVTRAR